jgi:hypothetical protein
MRLFRHLSAPPYQVLAIANKFQHSCLVVLVSSLLGPHRCISVNGVNQPPTDRCPRTGSIKPEEPAGGRAGSVFSFSSFPFLVIYLGEPA